MFSILGVALKAVGGIFSGIPLKVYLIVAGVALVAGSLAFGVHEWDKRQWNAGFNAGWSADHKNYVKFQNAVAVQTKKAQTDNQTYVTTVETKGSQVTAKTEKTLEQKISASHDSADAYVQRMSEQSTAADSGSSAVSVPQVGGSTGSAATASAGAFISTTDIEICAENTVKAQAWPEWYAQQQAIYNVPDKVSMATVRAIVPIESVIGTTAEGTQTLVGIDAFHSPIHAPEEIADSADDGGDQQSQTAHKYFLP